MLAPFQVWHRAAETFRRWKCMAGWKTAAMNKKGRAGTNISLIFVPPCFSSFIFHALPFPDVRRSILNSDRGNVCTLQGSLRPMHRWLASFTHSSNSVCIPLFLKRSSNRRLAAKEKAAAWVRRAELVHWEVPAQNCELWKQHFNKFSVFCCQ